MGCRLRALRLRWGGCRLGGILRRGWGRPWRRRGCRCWCSLVGGVGWRVLGGWWRRSGRMGLTRWGGWLGGLLVNDFGMSGFSLFGRSY